MIVAMDTATGQVIDGINVPELLAQVENLKHQNKVERKEKYKLSRKVDELKAMRNAEVDTDPRTPEVREIFARWQRACEHPTAKLDSKRFELIAKALKTYGHDRCVAAIDGFGAFRYVVDKKGRSRTGKASERHDGLEMIFRSAEFIEKGERLAERAGNEAPQSNVVELRPGVSAPGPERWANPPSIFRFADALRVEYGTDLVDVFPEPTGKHTVVGPCPLHPRKKHQDKQLLMSSESSAGSVKIRCVLGCDEEAVWRELLDLERRQEARMISLPEMRRQSLFWLMTMDEWELEWARRSVRLERGAA